ncbi:MAG: hypothetical protein DWI48_01460 [Chloroflexi bacterium]|nr:MAG: hypothetical protein DWI48_01460 [Chloroflexota bacterium]
MIDGGHEIDIDAVIQNIDEAEVVTLHFPMLRQTLLIDTRLDAQSLPLVRVVPMVNNTTERFASLEAMRPGLERPRSITMIPWARSVEALEWAGVWPRVIARLEASGDETTLLDARRAFRQLRSLELVELREAIVGRQYRTVWRARAEEAR